MGPEEIGNAIRRLRKARGMNRAEVAVRAGIAVNTLANIEQGKTLDPGVHVLIAVADVLGASIVELIYGDADATPRDTPAFRQFCTTELGQSLTVDELQHLRQMTLHEPYPGQKMDVRYLYAYVHFLRGHLAPEDVEFTAELNKSFVPRPARRRGKRRPPE